MAKSTSGFASMDKDKQRSIAAKGGRAAHQKGTAHEFNSEEGSAAAAKAHKGPKGHRCHEFDSNEARIAGRKGGLARGIKRDNDRRSKFK